MIGRSTLRGALDRRFARAVTEAVVRRPSLWRLLRRPFERQFNRLGPHWDTLRDANHLAPYEAALGAVAEPPRRALDVGTGTGDGALAIARRFPDAEVLGVDIAEGMLAEAKRKLPPELAGRVRFQRADAASLPFADSSFDLVGLANVVPFFDELARIVSPAGFVIFGFSGGAKTPIFVPFERLRQELGRRGFAEFTELQAGNGSALLARKRGAE